MERGRSVVLSSKAPSYSQRFFISVGKRVPCELSLHAHDSHQHRYFTQGCGCDIAAHWYSLSTELNPDWSSHYVGQPELLAYWESLWRKYGLEKHAIFNTFVTSAEWDESAQLYHITTKNQYNGRIDRVDAEIVIFANGAFKRPLYPKDIRNLTDFQGDMFHSARWRDDISLQGKRVAVIGNGCTA